MKLVIIGGGSQSTPSLFLSDVLAEKLDELDVTLVGRTREKLDAVARAIDIVSGGHRVTVSQDPPVALRGADLVVLQPRFGGYDGRAYDERFPLAFGIPGDEGLGPGGLSSAWRSWPPLRDLLADVERCAPHATVLLLTSPLGLLTRCAVTAYPTLRLFGLCELPWTTLQDVCTVAGADPEAASFDYAGTNHLGWFDRIDADARDLIAAYARSRPASGFPSTELVETLGAVPLKYFRLHYHFLKAVDEQRASTSRGEALARLEHETITVFKKGERATILAALAKRAAPWYAHALAPYIGGMLGSNVTARLFLTTTNNGYLSGFAEDDIVEIPHQCFEGSLRRIERRDALPPRLDTELRRFVEYERVAATAVLHSSPEDLVEALCLHPWVQTRATANALARAVCAGMDPATVVSSYAGSRNE